MVGGPNGHDGTDGKDGYAKAMGPKAENSPSGEHETKGLSHHKRTVKSMKDNFDFFKHAVEEVCSHGEPVSSEYRSSFSLDQKRDSMEADAMTDRFSSFSMSSSYSGIGAPEATLRLLKHTMEELFGTKVPMPKIYFQVEHDESCRKELFLCDQLDADADTCVFGDLLEFFVDELRDVIQDLAKRPDLAFEVLAKMVANGSAVKLSAWCHKHGRHCSLKLSVGLDM